MPAPAPLLLFDESHGQGLWFGAGPTVHKGYSRIAALARSRAEVAFNPVGSPISAALLRSCRAFVLVMGPQRAGRLSAEEMAALHAFVRAGGGLLVLGAYTGDWHHEANFNELLAEYGMAFNRDVILPAGSLPEHGFAQGAAATPESPHCVIARPAPAQGTDGEALRRGVARLSLPSACSLYVDEALAAPLFLAPEDARILEPVPLGIGIHIQRYQDRGAGPAPLIAAARQARVVAVGGWKLFLDPFVAAAAYDNARFFENLRDWLLATAGELAIQPAATASPAAPPAAPASAAEIAAIEAELPRLRALLANARTLTLTASGMELARLQTAIAELEEQIRQQEAELDRLHAG